jgi:hypothetical protein
VKFMAATIAFVLINCLVPKQSLADDELLGIAVEAVREATKQASDFLDNINWVENALNDIRAKKPVQSAKSTEWKDLTKNYQKLNDSINALEVQHSPAAEIVITANLKPRKCQGFKTPFQAILKELGKGVQIRSA